MKTFILIFTITASIVVHSKVCSDAPIGEIECITTDASKNLSTLIRKLDALGVKIGFTRELNYAIMECSVDTNLMLSLIMVESSFIVNAKNHYSSDYGLCQVNEYHVKNLNLDRKKLLTDVRYNVRIGCNIMKWFTKRYSLREAIMRYNVGTAKNAINSYVAKAYSDRVMYYYNILKEIKDETDQN